MKALVVSDVHKMEQRQKILDFFEGKRFDAILVNGDILGEHQIPQAVKEFGAVDRYLRSSRGEDLVKRCAPDVGGELVEFVKEMRNRHPSRKEMSELEKLLERYAEERYKGVLSFLGELTKSGHVFFNYGESESPYGLAIENEVVQLLGADPQAIMELRPTKAFPKFERALYDMEEETHLFHYVSGEMEEFGGYMIAGVPGVFRESKGSDQAKEQEAMTMRVLDQVEEITKLILLYHSAAPSTGVFGKTKGSDTLMSFLKRRTTKTIVVNSHYHLLTSVFLHVGKVWYVVPVAAINDEVGLIDTEGVRYFEVSVPHGHLTELSSVRLTDWDREVPDLLKRMY